MAKVKVLIEGWADFSKIWKDNCSVVLVESEKGKIIFDPGLDRKRLLSVLEKEKLNLDEINYIFISHKHTDHCLLMGIFPKAFICTGKFIYKSFTDLEQGEIKEDFFGTDIKIIDTPGHAKNHACLLVKTEMGNVLLAGDNFWWDRNEKQNIDYKTLIFRKDMFAENQELLEKTRKKLLKIADWIIPGHGKMFKNPMKKK